MNCFDSKTIGFAAKRQKNKWKAVNGLTFTAGAACWTTVCRNVPLMCCKYNTTCSTLPFCVMLSLSKCSLKDQKRNQSFFKIESISQRWQVRVRSRGIAACRLQRWITVIRSLTPHICNTGMSKLPSYFRQQILSPSVCSREIPSELAAQTWLREVLMKITASHSGSYTNAHFPLQLVWFPEETPSVRRRFWTEGGMSCCQNGTNHRFHYIL